MSIVDAFCCVGRASFVSRTVLRSIVPVSVRSTMIHYLSKPLDTVPRSVQCCNTRHLIRIRQLDMS